MWYSSLDGTPCQFWLLGDEGAGSPLSKDTGVREGPPAWWAPENRSHWEEILKAGCQGGEWPWESSSASGLVRGTYRALRVRSH